MSEAYGSLRRREKEEKRETVLACIERCSTTRSEHREDVEDATGIIFVMRKIQELGRACREVEKPDEPFELYYVFLGLGVIF